MSLVSERKQAENNHFVEKALAAVEGLELSKPVVCMNH